MRVALFMGLLAISVLAPASTAAAAPADRDSATFAARVLDLTNAERQNAGLPPLAPSPQLTQAAQTYSQVLASSDCFAHTCGPVPDFAARDAQAGYATFRDIGENIAAGYATPEEVVAGWMASPGHRENILSPDFTDMGVGMVSGGGQYGIYWTQEFGARP